MPKTWATSRLANWLIGVFGAVCLLGAILTAAPVGYGISIPLLAAGLWSFVSFYLAGTREHDTPIQYAGADVPVCVLVQVDQEPEEQVIATVSSARPLARVILLGEPQKVAHLAQTLGIEHADVATVTELTFHGGSVVLPIWAGSILDADAVQKDANWLRGSDASWLVCRPTLDNQESYVPPQAYLSTTRLIQRATVSGARMWLTDSTLVDARLLTRKAWHQATELSDKTIDIQWGALLANTPNEHSGLSSPHSWVRVLPPFDADAYWRIRMEDTMVEARNARLAVTSGTPTARLAGWAVIGRLLRGLPMAVAVVASASLAIAGAQLSTIPLLMWAALLAGPVVIRSMLLGQQHTVKDLIGSLVSGLVEMPVSIAAAPAALLKHRSAPDKPAKLASHILRFTVLLSVLSAVTGAVLNVLVEPVEGTTPNYEWLWGVLGVAVISLWCGLVLAHLGKLDRSGRASARAFLQTPVEVSGVQTTTVDISLGGLRVRAAAGISLTEGDLVTLNMTGLTFPITAVVLHSSSDWIALKVQGTGVENEEWVHWVLEQSGLTRQAA